MRVKCEWLICRWRERGTDWLLYVHTHYKNYFLRPELNAYQTMEETSGREQSNRSCFCFLFFEVFRCIEDRGESDHPGRQRRSLYTMQMTATLDWLEGTRFQYATLCKRYIWEITCQERDSHEALFMQLEFVWPLHSWEFAFCYSLFIDICYGLSVFMYIFGKIYIHIDLFFDFFFFNSDLPHIPAANKSGVRVQNVSRK